MEDLASLLEGQLLALEHAMPRQCRISLLKSSKPSIS
ncbi:unnamed protein product [Ixodes persulcatus]